jgi:hypothetical protein
MNLPTGRSRPAHVFSTTTDKEPRTQPIPFTENLGFRQTLKES